MTLKCGLESRSLKVVPFESLGTVSYSPSIITMAVSAAILEIFSVKEWLDLDLEIWVWGSSRSLKMAWCDRPCMTFYLSAIVTIALSCTVCELFDVEYYRDIEMWLDVAQCNWNWCHSKACVCYSPSIVTMAVSVAVCEIFSVRVVWPWKQG